MLVEDEGDTITNCHNDEGESPFFFSRGYIQDFQRINEKMIEYIKREEKFKYNKRKYIEI